jgi:hypothetical protein
MSTPDALDPLQAIAATANDLFDILEIYLGPSTPGDEKYQLEPLELALPGCPNPASSLRALGLSKKLTKRLCNLFSERINDLREATIEEFQLAESTLRSTVIQERLAQVFVGSFTRTMHDLFEQTIDSALDFLTINQSDQVLFLPSHCTTSLTNWLVHFQPSTSSTINKGKSRSKKGRHTARGLTPPAFEYNPEQPASSSSSSGGSSTSGSSGASSSSGDSPVHSSRSFDKVSGLLYALVITESSM